MKPRTPKRIKGKIRRIVVPKALNNTLSLLPHQISEGMGFVYGVKKGDDIYLGTASHKHSIWKKEINPTSENLEGESGERYIQVHNRICKKGEREFKNFVQIVYHSHPKLIERDLSEECKKELYLKYPEFEGDTKELISRLDNTWLSEDDVNFIRKYSSKGLALLAIGKEGDVRHGPIISLPKMFFKKSLRYLLNHEKSRLKGFQVNSEGVWEVPLVIAEDSEKHKDEEICSEIVSSMVPLSETFFDYGKEIIKRSKENHPKLTRMALQFIKKYPLYNGDTRKKLLDE